MMMPLTSTSSADSFQSSRAMYQALPAFSALYPTPRRRVSVLRHPRGCNLARPCALASQITRMLLFNACSAVLSVLAALVVWTGAALAVVTMPLCGCGLSVFHGLLHAVFYLCCTDAFIYNALAASAADCIDMDLAEWGGRASRGGELYPLLPIRVPPSIAGRGGQLFEPCPRFESSLGAASPRSVLATVYFGCFKMLVGAGQMVAVGLVLGVLGFLVGDKRVPVHLDALTAQHPFAVYTSAFGLLLLALTMLHAVTRVSKVVTRFFCCEATC
ncbi:hypothetical protein PHYPSEUDO_008977 [Phytophthora pseudosyringae]|uniref:Uncharacterized protein n=1 Tax=Phytophthora pseudosyringae TaxID=221518 RepID=A0A8T1W9L9_9STRA|nr:hypothetical protein PHYPSEUDO_008977 [Phytophthora pseudosyringae]